jgi:uracil-DNA glycosylase
VKSDGRFDSLADLQARLHSCRLCLEAGYDIYPRAIFSGGLGARLMVIGQAPGITEKEAGRPFNAGSGKRLFQWLAQAGIDETWFRATQYMCSVTRCYPGRSRSGSGDRVPSRSEQQLCRGYLEAEIALIDPILILPVGRVAIQMFYPPDQSLEAIIGTETQLDRRWIVPLPHPSGASRWHQNQENRQRVRQAIDLIKIRAEMIFGAR